MHKLILSFLVLSLCLSAVFAHSWIDCTDYTEENGQYYSATKCRARPRNWAAHNAINSAFGGDTGYNHQDTSCKYALTGGNYQSFYTSSFPMATYKPGQKVCLAWPAKNHVAASCTNQYIPDNGNKIYYSSLNPSSDPSVNDWKLLADWGNNVAPATLENGGGKAFQNCPKFCENMDKALCTGCFTIPTGLAEGRYAFQWRWVFNAGGAPYTSCWDAQVTSTGTPVTPTPASSTGSSNSGSTNNNNTPLVGNAIRVKVPPVKIPLNSPTVTLDVDYSASVSVDIVVDFLRLPDYSWFGKAIQKNVAAGTGTLSMTVKIQNSPTEGSYVLKPWIVEAGKAEVDKGWTYEMDRKEYSVQYTDKVVTVNSAVKKSIVSVVTLFAMIAVLLL